MGLSISVSSVFFAVSVASAIGIGACSPARVPAKAQTLEEVLAPAVVWDEARDAMGIVLAAHDGALVLPGSPALRCTLSSQRATGGVDAGGIVSIDCGVAKLSGASKQQILRQINDGEIHRQAALTVAAEVDSLGAAMGLLIDPEISPVRGENEFVFWVYDPQVSERVPAVRVLFNVLEKGRLRAEAESALGKRAKLETSSFYDLGRKVERLRLESRLDTAKHDAAIRLIAWSAQTLETLRVSPREVSFAGVKLGASLEQINSVIPFSARNDFHVVSRIYPDLYKSYVSSPQNTNLFVALLDGKVRSVRSLLDSPPNIDPVLVPHACQMVRDELARALEIASSSITMTAGPARCTLSMHRENQEITLTLIDPIRRVPEVELHENDLRFDMLTQDAERRFTRQGFLDSCQACAGKIAETNPRTAGQHIVEIDRKLCIQKVRKFVKIDGKVVADPKTQPVELGCNQHYRGW